MKFMWQGCRNVRDDYGQYLGDFNNTDQPDRPSLNESLRNVIEHGCVGHILYDHTFVGNFIGQHPVFLEYGTAIAQFAPSPETAQGMIDFGAECLNIGNEPLTICLRGIFRKPDIIFEIADKIGQLIQYRGRDDDLAHYCL